MLSKKFLTIPKMVR
jgi:hypothetical protein